MKLFYVKGQVFKSFADTKTIFMVTIKIRYFYTKWKIELTTDVS